MGEMAHPFNNTCAYVLISAVGIKVVEENRWNKIIGESTYIEMLHNTL